MRCSCSSATARTGPDVEALAAELGVADRVPARSAIAEEHRVAGTASFDAFLLTSANEGTPVVAIEALAAARARGRDRAPAAPAPSSRDGESGYLEAIGDTQALADRLAALARRPGAAGARWAKQARGRCGRASRSAGWRTRSTRSTTALLAVKVLHLHKLTGVSGSERHLLALLPALRERGVDARFLGARRSRNRRRTLLRAARRAAAFPGRRGPLRPRRSRRGWRATSIARSARSGPTCVHTHLVHADVYGSIAAARLLGMPVRLDPAQRRPLPARAVPLRRPRLRAAGTPA